ncbi:hypothetical protein [Parasitella parasitica]|uniref:FAS1 domain-containing protein n=1 Tax=Parasitella parasitica TaxID=35722 RepID=A0A0B7NJJ5_9FUNG|nr:hypothetical protein [Parasitella parasitica]
MLPNIISILVGCLCLSLGVLAQQALSSTAQDQQPLKPLSNVYELLMHLPEASKFSSLLDPELQTYLQNQTNITVFAPHNNAFHQTLLLDKNTTKYHLLPQLCLDDCWSGESLYKSTSYMKLWMNHNINTKQIESGNMQSAAVIRSIQVPSQHSVVHIIDSILTVPRDIETTLEALKFTKAKDMVSQIRQRKNSSSNSNDATEMITLFIPNNQAFGTVDPSTLGFDINVMIYNVHAVQGLHTSQELKNSNITTMQNFAGSNITIHDNQGMCVHLF